MAFKVLIGQKNSKWKVVQNPLKGNFYTDIVDFQNDADKEEFLNQNFFPDWKNLENGSWVETPLKWHDEIHAEFTIDLEKTKFSRSEALRKDFCCVYDSNEQTYKFYTMEAHLSSKQVYTTLIYVIELDLFFTYDIKKIWKDNVSVALQQGIPQQQWKGAAPLISRNNILAIPENLGDLTDFQSSTQILPAQAKTNGLLLFIKPRTVSQDVNIQGPQGNQKLNIPLTDCFLIGATSSTSGINSVYIYIENDRGDQESGVTYLNSGNHHNVNYPDNQKVDGYKKNEKYVILFIGYEELDNDLTTKGLKVGDILNSPDLLLVVPHYTPSQYTAVRSFIPSETKAGTNMSVLLTADLSRFAFGFNRSTYQGYRFKSLGSLNATTINDTFRLTIDHKLIDNYDPSQYAKMYSQELLKLKLVNSNKQNITLIPENLDLATTPTEPFVKNGIIAGGMATINFKRELIFTLEGNFGKVTINSGLYILGSLRNPYVLEESNTIRGYQNSSDWLNYVKNNLTSINQQAKLLKKQSVLNIVNGVAAMASGGSISLGSPSRREAGQAMLEPSQKAMETGYTLLDNGKYYQGASLVRTGLSGFNQGQQNLAAGAGPLPALAAGGVISGIEMLINSKNRLQQFAADLRSKQEAGSTITNVGSEFDRLNLFDSVWPIELQVYQPNDKVKEAVGQHFHRFGYNVSGVYDSPLNWLSNGLYWDYFQADFNSLYQAFNENLSPQESKIAALSLSQGVRVWHWKPDIYEGWQVGDYSKRNIRF